MLVAAGADVNLQGDQGVSSLFLAVQNGHIVIAEELILHGADVDTQTAEGYTCLYSAAQRGDLEVVQLLLFHSAHVNLHEQNGFSALHVASLNGHRKVRCTGVKCVLLMLTLEKTYVILLIFRALNILIMIDSPAP